jgi:hypothetical protein
LALSADSQQQFLYVGADKGITVVDRKTLVSTLAPLRALWARTPVPAWARRAVGEGVKSCPRAGCGKSACPIATDSKGNIYLAQTTAGMQKLVFKGMPPTQ